MLQISSALAKIEELCSGTLRIQAPDDTLSAERQSFPAGYPEGILYTGGMLNGHADMFQQPITDVNAGG